MVGLETLVSQSHWRQHEGAQHLLATAREGANRLEEYLTKEEGIVVCIDHGADADGFSGRIIKRQIERSGYLTGNRTRFVYENPFHVSNDPEDPDSIQSLLAKHGEDAFYFFSDIGGLDLKTVSALLPQGIIVDHHPPKGRCSENFVEINPLREGFDGNDLSGASGTYLIFDAYYDSLSKQHILKSSKYAKQLSREVRQTALLAALGGASADHIGDQSLNGLLYDQARGMSLLYEKLIGCYGIQTKPLTKIVAESTIHANLKFPVMRQQYLRKSLKKSLGLASLTNDQNLLVQELFYLHPDLFMVEFNKEHLPTVDDHHLYINMQRAQFLNTEEIAKINKAMQKFGLKEPLLVEEQEENLRIIRVNEQTGIKESRFLTFQDDIKDTEERYQMVEATIRSQLIAYRDELITQGKHFSTRVIDEKSDFSHCKVSSFSEDEVDLLRGWWVENIRAYSDPFRIDKTIAEIERPSNIIHKGPYLFKRLTVSELGNRLTALSKIGMRDTLIEALEGDEKAGEKVLAAHKLYKRILYHSLRYIQNTEGILHTVKDRVHLIDLQGLDDVVKKVVNEEISLGSVLSEKDDLQDIKIENLNGVITGIKVDSRKLPGEYGILCSIVPVAGNDKMIKISVRVSENEEMFQIHLGNELMSRFNHGGGHKTAAATRMHKDQLPAFEEALLQTPINDEKYQHSDRIVAVLRR